MTLADGKSRRYILLFFTVVAALMLLAEVYARWPATFDVPAAEIDPGTTHLILVFHGSEGVANPGVIAVEKQVRSLLRSPSSQVVRYRWAPWSDNRWRAAVNGMHIGEALGRQITASQVNELHLIGHSAGAWPVYRLCEQLRQSAPQVPVIRITLLDAIGIRGMFDFAFGERHFGRCADFAEAIINTDDPVPTTNTPLPHAFNYDVTASREEGIPGHEWPLWYYRNQLQPSWLNVRMRHSFLPRGAVATEGNARAAPPE